MEAGMNVASRHHFILLSELIYLLDSVHSATICRRTIGPCTVGVMLSLRSTMVHLPPQAETAAL